MQVVTSRPIADRDTSARPSLAAALIKALQDVMENLAAAILGLGVERGRELPSSGQLSPTLAKAIAGPALGADEWFWLSTRLLDAGECRYCLQRALAADPGHSLAHNALLHMG